MKCPLITELRSQLQNSFMLSNHPYIESETGEDTDVLYNNAVNW